MSRRPALHRRPLHTGALLIAVLGVGTVAAPAALAMVDPTAPAQDQAAAPAAPRVLTNSPVSYLGTPDEPVEFGVGKLQIAVQPEPGFQVPAGSDLSGATVRVTDTTEYPDDVVLDLADEEDSVTCTTDAEGICVFAEEDEPFFFPEATFTIEQLTPPTSGLFDLPPGQDRIVYGAVPLPTLPNPELPTIPVPPVPTTTVPTTTAPTTTTTPTTTTQTTTTSETTTTTQTTTTSAQDTAATSPVVGAAGDVDRVAPDVTQEPAPLPLPFPLGVTNQVVFYDPLLVAATTPATTAPATSTAAAATTTAAAPTTTRATAAALATTGSDVVPVAVLGGAMVAAGAGGLLLARRRSTR